VVVNTVEPPSAEAINLVRAALGDRGRIVEWRDATDDRKLGVALTAILDRNKDSALRNGPGGAEPPP
jgi:hypothetical protein